MQINCAKTYLVRICPTITQEFFKVLSHTGDGESIKLPVRHEFVIWADKLNGDASG